VKGVGHLNAFQSILFKVQRDSDSTPSNQHPILEDLIKWDFSQKGKKHNAIGPDYDTIVYRLKYPWLHNSTCMWRQCTNDCRRNRGTLSKHHFAYMSISIVFCLHLQVKMLRPQQYDLTWLAFSRDLCLHLQVKMLRPQQYDLTWLAFSRDLQR
jgi:hypothetical protein